MITQNVPTLHIGAPKREIVTEIDTGEMKHGTSPTPAPPEPSAHRSVRERARSWLIFRTYFPVILKASDVPSLDFDRDVHQSLQVSLANKSRERRPT